MGKKLDVTRSDAGDIEAVGDLLRAKIATLQGVADKAITFTDRRQAKIKVDVLTEFLNEVF